MAKESAGAESCRLELQKNVVNWSSIWIEETEILFRAGGFQIPIEHHEYVTKQRSGLFGVPVPALIFFMKFWL